MKPHERAREDERMMPSKAACFAASQERQRFPNSEVTIQDCIADILKAAYSIDFVAHQQAMQDVQHENVRLKNEVHECFVSIGNMEQAMQGLQARVKDLEVKRDAHRQRADALQRCEDEHLVRIVKLKAGVTEQTQRADQLQAEVDKWTRMAACAGFDKTGLLAVGEELQKRDKQLADQRVKIERYHDLVRHQRSELHEAGLLSDAEYAAFMGDSGKSVDRLQSYDAMRAENERLKVELLDQE